MFEKDWLKVLHLLLQRWLCITKVRRSEAWPIDRDHLHLLQQHRVVHKVDEGTQRPWRTMHEDQQREGVVSSNEVVDLLASDVIRILGALVHLIPEEVIDLRFTHTELH